MGNKQKMIDYVVSTCADDSVGYSQINRWRNPDVDCSSFMYLAAEAGGYDVPKSGTRYTGTMRNHFVNAGFTAVRFDGNLNDLDPGDIMLHEADHTEMYIGGGKFGGAHIDENGSVYGNIGGDQTGNEVSIVNAYNYPWQYVLIPPVDGESSGGDHTNAIPDSSTQGNGVVYEVSTVDHGWLGSVSYAGEGTDGYAGWNNSPINGIRAYRQDGKSLSIQVCTKQLGWCEPTLFTGTLFGSNSDGDGYAGNLSPKDYIIGIKVTGADIRVACSGEYFSWMSNGTTPEGDNFAGDDLSKVRAITAVQMKV